jgi:uncharacterized protein YaaN involved in tellurite resistance
MSDLTKPAAETAAPSASLALTLKVPAPVPVVQEEQAEGLRPVAPEKVEELRGIAQAFAAEMVTLTPNSPELGNKVREIEQLGAAELANAANSSNRMLERPASALSGTSGKSAIGPQAKAAKTLGELRTTVVTLTPNRADLEGQPVRKFLGFIPGGNKIEAYFERYKSAQSQLDAITKALAASQDELLKDNASIEEERVKQWNLMGELTEYALLLAELDGSLDSRILEIEAGDASRGAALRSDVQFVVRQRRQDILTQLAVSAQGYLAMDMVSDNNLELIKGVERAKTTTLAALRTAVIVAEALTNQKLVLNQIEALNSTTSDVIANNAAMLRTQSAEIQKQAASSTIDIQKLEQAFTDVFATMDSIDTFRAEAVKSMGATVTSLEGQLEKAKPYLERAQNDSLTAGTPAKQLGR